MISISMLVSAVFYLIIVGLIFWLLFWLIGFCNVPEPFNKIASVILAVLAVAMCIGILLSLMGGQPLFRP